jgi:RNA polymerase sigma-70 factor, ECF subfamily
MSAVPPLEPATEVLLVRRAMEGDEAAFGILIAAYERRLLYFIGRIVGRHDLAFDILQDVWLLVFRKLGRLRSAAAFRVWLYRLAHDQAVSLVRRERRQTRIEETVVIDESESSIDEFAVRERAEWVHRSLDRLNDDHRTILSLRFLEDWSMEDLAEILRLPPGTVKSRLHYAKLALRRLWEEDGHDYA